MGTLKGVGRIYQQTFIDTYSRVAIVKLYDRKNGLVAADLLNDRVVPFFDEQGVKLQRVLTDRGSEYCGNLEHHAYQLYLAVEDIDHSRTKAYSPQTNGMCERFHRTMLDEFYRIAFRKKIYRTLDELQTDVDAWIHTYNHDRPHSGRYCYGKTPMQTFLESKKLALDKQLDQNANSVLTKRPQAEVEGTDGLLGQGAERSAERAIEDGRVPLTQQAVAYTTGQAALSAVRDDVAQQVHHISAVR